jgi:hypothetical protein
MQKAWSRNRPVRPDVDPLLKQIRFLIAKDPRSTWAKANVSGLSPTTINSWLKGKTRHPQAASLQMAARMLGKKLVLEDK